LYFVKNTLYRRIITSVYVCALTGLALSWALTSDAGDPNFGSGIFAYYKFSYPLFPICTFLVAYNLTQHGAKSVSDLANLLLVLSWGVLQTLDLFKLWFLFGAYSAPAFF